MAEIIFHRTCNYWIDAGIVGLYDTLSKPVPNLKAIGAWPEAIKGKTLIDIELKPEYVKITAEKDNQIDNALTYALELVRKSLYDVSSEKQIDSPEKDGRVKQMSTPAGELVASGKQADYTYFRKEIFRNIGEGKVFLPLKENRNKHQNGTCVFCGNKVNVNLAMNKANEVFVGDTLKSSPFIEGNNSNRCFHSYFKGSEKCWQCGFVTFFAPLLLFYKRQSISRSKKDTYYILPYLPGNLEITHKLYRSLSGKRGLARAIGSDHTTINYESHFYESHFQTLPKGVSAFTLSFYYDLCERLLPKTTNNLLRLSQEIGLVDDHGAVFQTALFLKRDSGQKSFIMRETTVDKSAYFIKQFAYLKKKLEVENKSNLLDALYSFMKRSSDSQVIQGQKFRRNQLQRLSVLRATQTLADGKHVYKFLLPIISPDLREETSRPYEVYQITILFQSYDQWLFKKEDNSMASLVKKAKESGWHLSQDFWKNTNWDGDEKKNLIKRYYYNIERAPSPVKFLEHVRHAYKKIEREIPKEMVFHEEDGSDNMKKFEVYRVYFLAGMLNGFLNRGKESEKLITDQIISENDNGEEVGNND